ncbi:MAG: aldehyde dehydrogenase [Gammaproteobacteria bacterium]|nr:MAG: aldehyde dehydrogenase [Gammaproteobacteria bacterium]
MDNIFHHQRLFFQTGVTLPIAFRLTQLRKLKSLIQTHESAIVQALHLDLHKAPQEAMLHEILLVLKEIDFAIKHLKKWSRVRKVPTPFFLWPGRSEIHFEPYGCTLIIGPWNYPFLLLMSPLIGAISAGNCAVIKPSELAPHTQQVILQLINQHFSPDYLMAIAADAEQMSSLLAEKFDYIFFTGGTTVGKIVMQAAAKQLTPVTLELGGKSPCIVDETANLDLAARRIMWAKTINAGQVCIAPDYVYVHESCKEALVNKMQNVLHQFYGDDPEKSPSYGRIINQAHFARLVRLMQKGTILCGGKINAATRYISPTLIHHLTWEDPIMQEEIFGPLLPILTYQKIDEVIHTIQQQPKSLALYLFTHDQENEHKVLTQLSFGNGCVNDCVVQITQLQLPFGGVGASGMGQYHGQYSFETFSHRKSLYKKSLAIEFKLEYPPLSDKKLGWIKRLFNL